MKIVRFSYAAFLIALSLVLLSYPPGGGSVLAQSDDVLAAIGEDRITRKDLENLLKSYPPSFREQFETPDGQDHLLREVVRIEVFSREAEALELHRSESFQAKLKAIAKALLAEEYTRQRVLSEVAIEEQEIRDYYERHRDRFTIPERIRAPAIFFALPADAPPEQVAEKEAKARSAAARLQNGEDFTAIAETFSERPYRDDSEYFSRGRLVPEIEERVFILNKRDVSPVLRVTDGLLVFRMEDRLPAEVSPYPTAREEALRQLRAEKRFSRFEEVEHNLFQKYRVTFAEVATTPSREPGETLNGKPTLPLVGKIVSISGSQGEKTKGEGATTIFVHETDVKGSIGQASITLTGKTALFLRRGKNLEAVGAVRLKVGQTVEIDLDGPVASSYPAQARASRVVILDDVSE